MNFELKQIQTNTNREMLSTKRNHASILAETTANTSSTTNNDKSAAKLSNTLSKSLKEILLPNNNLTST